MLVYNQDLLATQLRQKRGQMNNQGGGSCPSPYSQKSQHVARLGGASHRPTALQTHERIVELVTIQRTLEILGEARTHGIQDKFGIRLGGERYQQDTFSQQLLQRHGSFHGQFLVTVGIDNAQATLALLHRFQQIDIPITAQVIRHIADEGCSQHLCPWSSLPRTSPQPTPKLAACRWYRAVARNVPVPCGAPCATCSGNWNASTRISRKPCFPPWGTWIPADCWTRAS